VQIESPSEDRLAIRVALRFGPISFIPAAISHGIGSEIQRPLARVVVGGLISSSIVLVLPVVYALTAERGERGEGTHTNSVAGLGGGDLR
jgi:hypothetical protein